MSENDTVTPTPTTPDAPVAAVTPVPVTPVHGRYSVAEDGRIFWQENATNPLPGEPVGQIAKGDALLHPLAVAEGRADVQDWMDIHVRAVLEPLFMLKQSEGEGALTGVAREIGDRLYDHLGVMHRSDLEDLIAGLDPDARKTLRGKGVRLGPVLVFLPALVKPAAVRMRALLWGVWNGKTLPVTKPADGRVSEVVDANAVDRGFYRMIGYPVFGPRAIRIDMLDRVVTDIYDTALQGVFEAKHKYAEWLGCGLEDLHAVLESMGHRKLKAETPAVVEDAAAQAPAEPVAADVMPAVAAVVSDVVAEVVSAPAPEEEAIASAPVAKAAPVLVKFMLKRGKMSERPAHRHARPQHNRPQRAAAPEGEAQPERSEKSDRPDRAEKKFAPKKAYDPNRPQNKGPQNKGGHRDSDEGDERPRKPKFDRSRDRDDSRQARVYTFEGKKTDGDDDSNPFAILKNFGK